MRWVDGCIRAKPRHQVGCCWDLISWPSNYRWLTNELSRPEDKCRQSRQNKTMTWWQLNVTQIVNYGMRKCEHRQTWNLATSWNWSDEIIIRPWFLFDILKSGKLSNLSNNTDSRGKNIIFIPTSWLHDVRNSFVFSSSRGIYGNCWKQNAYEE